MPTIRKSDLERAWAIERALRVLVQTQATRQFLEAADPKALEQAVRALGDQTMRCSCGGTVIYPTGHCTLCAAARVALDATAPSGRVKTYRAFNSAGRAVSVTVPED